MASPCGVSPVISRPSLPGNVIPFLGSRVNDARHVTGPPLNTTKRMSRTRWMSLSGRASWCMAGTVSLITVEVIVDMLRRLYRPVAGVSFGTRPDHRLGSQRVSVRGPGANGRKLLQVFRESREGVAIGGGRPQQRARCSAFARAVPERVLPAHDGEELVELSVVEVPSGGARACTAPAAQATGPRAEGREHRCTTWWITWTAPVYCVEDYVASTGTQRGFRSARPVLRRAWAWFPALLRGGGTTPATNTLSSRKLRSMKKLGASLSMLIPPRKSSDI